MERMSCFLIMHASALSWATLPVTVAVTGTLLMILFPLLLGVIVTRCLGCLECQDVVFVGFVLTTAVTLFCIAWLVYIGYLRVIMYAMVDYCRDT